MLEQFITKKEVLDKGIEVLDKSIEREGNKYKEALEYIRNIPRNIIKETILIGPNFVKFIITALNHPSNDAKTKILFTGVIISLSTLLGFMIWDISLITMLFAIGAFAGPLTIIGGVVFGSLILLIKSALTAFLILIAMKLSNMMYEDTVIQEIAIEAFGIEKGKSFIESWNKLTSFDNGKIDKFVSSVKEYFLKIGEKNKDINISEIENKIDLKVEKTLKENNDFQKKSKFLEELKFLKRKEPLDESLIILILTLLYRASSIDGDVNILEKEVLSEFIKEEYILDNNDLEKFFNLIDHEKDMTSLLVDIKKLVPQNKIHEIVEVVHKIILADGVITDEEQLLFDVLKDNLL